MPSSQLSRALRESRELAALATDRDGLTIWCSQGFSMVSGYLESELIGRKPGAVLQSPASDPLVIRRIGMHITAGLPVTAELLNKHKSGSDYWTHLQIIPVLDDGENLTGFLSLQRDISAEVQHRLDRKEALLNRMLLVFSHEVRTPIHSLCNLIDLMATERPLDEAQRRALLSMAGAAANSLQSMVNELLDAAKLDAQEHEHPAAMSAVHLPQLLADLEAMTQGYPRKPGVRLAFRCDPSGGGRDAVSPASLARSDEPHRQRPEVHGTRTGRDPRRTRGTGRRPRVRIAAVFGHRYWHWHCGSRPIEGADAL
jgi:PAS domain S-box-containing protein